MKKTLLNRIRQTTAALAVSLTAATTVLAQSAVDQNFARELKLVEGLRVYNSQLQKQLKAQQTARSEIVASIAKSKEMGTQVMPLAQRMLTALEKFIQADLPFRKDERLESVGRLKALMVDPAATPSDRFRNIMDIYTLETEYGNTYEAYAGEEDINGNGTKIPVDILRIGRLGLYCQSRDQKTSAIWDRTSNAWKVLPGGDNRNIRTAIKVAAKTVAPELISLPISAPEGE